MTDNLFTFVLDFDGGTYISQFRGHDRSEACEKWVEGMDISAIRSVAKITRSELRREVDIREAVGIEGMTNVWCLSFVVKKKLGLLNVVQTDARNPKSKIQNPK